MTYWTWDPSLSVGVDVIDGQHRRIVDYINELDLARKDDDRARIGEILSNLVDYTRTHFAFEEDLMARSGYPLSESHKQVHRSYVAHIDKFVEQHRAGKDVTRRLMSELQIWLTNHIRNADTDYAPYAQKSLNRNKGWIGNALSRLFD
ncbi:MAG: bacteriohemerythrin [Chromatiaceae bacterium]|nr:bacteriohemerythrin [Gammaproteobacteria bacterium]MCP5305710.1 bacteriohemerythrin [Chromatiaceae bacterium]MCP5312567.1 bacteriohemerythrin [Chromatiaceae bacterium]